jgi:solute carrier family 45 protein 1/2/4
MGETTNLGLREPFVASDAPINKDLVPRLSVIRLVGITGGELAMQVAYSTTFAVGNPMMGKLKIPEWAFALIQTSDPLAGIFVQPLFGVISDRCRAKLGRRRPFVIGGSIGVVFFFLVMLFVEQIGLMFSAVHSLTWSRFLFVVSYLGICVSINLMQSPARTLIQDLMPGDQRILGNSIGAFMVAAGVMLVNLLGGLRVAHYLHKNLTDLELTIIVGMTIYVLSIIATCVAGRETQFLGHVPTGNPLKESFLALRQMPKPVFRIAIVYFFTFFAYCAFQVVVTDFFGKDVYLGDPTIEHPYRDGVCFGMLTVALSFGLTMIYLPFNDAVLKRIGIANLFTIVELAGAIGFCAAWWTTNKWVLMGFFSITGFMFGVALSVPFSVIGLSSPPEKFGTFDGAMSFYLVAGLELAYVVWELGVGAMFKQRGPIIGASALAAIGAAIASRFLIEPQIPVRPDGEDDNDSDPLPLPHIQSS